MACVSFLVDSDKRASNFQVGKFIRRRAPVIEREKTRKLRARTFGGEGLIRMQPAAQRNVRSENFGGTLALLPATRENKGAWLRRGSGT